MRKKKILSILPSVYLYGKERSNIEVYKLLQENKNVDLFVLINRKASVPLKSALSQFDTFELDFPNRRHSRFRILLYFIGLIRSNVSLISYLLKIRPQVLFLNSEMNIYDFFITFILFRTITIYRIGDIPAYPQLMGYKFNSLIWKQFVINRISKIVSISNFIKNEVDQTGRNNSNDCVIYNYPPQRYENLSALNISFCSKKSLKIGYLGQILALKGVHILLDAAIKLIDKEEDVEFIFSGSLKNDIIYSDSLRSKLLTCKHPEKVQFLGEINNIKSFFDQIDVLCVPTVWPEALGNVLVEAKLNYTPVIIFPSGGMPELINHLYSGYLCKEKTSEELINAINYYIDNREQVRIQGNYSNASLDQLGITYANFKQQWYNIFELTDVR